MKIGKAIKEAQKSGRGIARHKDEPRPCIYIPTNTSAGIIVLPNYQQAFIRWEPRLDDLTAKDWFVIG
ncbi:hypothetical protein ACFP3T_11240 [Lactiplantibacillus dongliensis]|uniref:Thoeris anti-defense 2-like domain-containing protein n=1 Tax=Lactiplantibacillus dongliensis TaxID=2559919 RepID=A0ABW1R996_9LACO|nr:hypothetical protein [Lactiplantibacillus dongliensis]